MLGDIAPKLLSLLHTARLYQFDKMRLQKISRYNWHHSYINWFQRARICMKKTNQWNCKKFLGIHEIVNFMELPFPEATCYYVSEFGFHFNPVYLSLFASLTVPLRKSTSSPWSVQPNTNQSIGMVEDFISKRALQNSKFFSEEHIKRRLFLSQNFPTK